LGEVALEEANGPEVRETTGAVILSVGTQKYRKLEVSDLKLVSH
jgi:hypothetical protein